MFDKLFLNIREKLLAKYNYKVLNKYRFYKRNLEPSISGLFPGVFKNQAFINIELSVFAEDIGTLSDPYQLTNVIDRFQRASDPFGRRSDREEIRRRLAKGAENYRELPYSKPAWNSNLSTRLQLSESIAYDTETNSSDSETCPKLSRTKPTATNKNDTDVPALEQIPNQNPYYASPLTISLENGNRQEAKAEQESPSDDFYSREDNECDFFTKQAKLQIETRMALAQAKNMAHRQMEIERHNQRISPITAVIRGSLDTIGIRSWDDKRRVSRHMLTNMNIAQLQILLNNLHAHIEKLNETLVKHLMERDDLHVSQDAMLVDIEELTRYIGAKEQIVQQQRRLSFLRKF